MKMRITSISLNGINVLKQWEDFKSSPYLDTGKVPTIGYGFTYYMDGTRVTMKDKPITEDYANSMLLELLKPYEKSVDSFTRDDLKQYEFDALVMFTYNVGIQSFRKSTLLKKINIDPLDITIPNEFRKWIYDNGKKIKGLINRRNAEIKLYTNE